MIIRWLTVFVYLLSASLVQGADAPDVEVVALFSGAAMLKSGQDQELIRVGEATSQGVILVSADSRSAVLRINGVEHELGISEHIASSYREASKVSVSIKINERGQYRTLGSINERQVEFLVDTGANIIAMNISTARGLGLDFEGGRTLRSQTAGGAVAATEVFLERVDVGGIKAQNVRAVVMPGDSPPYILLGMSFLQHVEMRENAGLLQLTSQF